MPYPSLQTLHPQRKVALPRLSVGIPACPPLRRHASAAKRMKIHPLPLFLLVSMTRLALAAGDGEAFFESNIRPLLINHCLECHDSSKGKTKGQLDLSHAAGWQKGGESGPAIVPGNPGESILMKAVHYSEANMEMPPKGKLASTQIALLHEWIQRGAEDPRTAPQAKGEPTANPPNLTEASEFWAWKPPVKPEIVTSGHPVDFLLQNQDKPTDAEAHVVLRRLTFLLTGLPPTLEELERFSASYAANPAKSHEMMVEALLKTDAYAEEMARRWLSVARFTESSGGGRSLLYKDAWKYRDWVIEAFRSSMPMDTFLQKQIAGDLMPQPSSREEANLQQAAIGFLCMGPTNYEEQDKQQLRWDIIDEQLDTIGKAFLGQTIGCARCHDHKFDPISQNDYYALVCRSGITLC